MLQIASGKNRGALIRVQKGFADTLDLWVAGYFEFEVTTALSSQKVQRRDLDLFLAASNVAAGAGRLSARTISAVWDEACALAQIKGRTPHSARHAMGRHIIEKTSNVAAVQRQLSHKNAVYRM